MLLIVYRGRANIKRSLRIDTTARARPLLPRGSLPVYPWEAHLEGEPVRRILLMAAATLFLLLPASSSPAQAGAHVQTETRKTSTPYTGDLSIFDSPGRDERLQINRVMDILQIGPGKNVADIGAGSGWFTVRAARRVADSGTVYAVDINPEAVRYVTQRADQEHLGNVKTILSRTDDALLPAHQVDAVLLLKTYHEVERPITLLRHLRSSLRPGARVGVIDRNGNGQNHGVSSEVVIREAREAGYQLVGQYDFVKPDDMDYFLVFSVKPE